MKPNWRRDKRKPRPIDGICSISGCRKPSGVTYYIWPLCNEHHDYYADLEAPCVLKKILGIALNDQEKIEIERWFDGNKPRARIKPKARIKSNAGTDRQQDSIGHGKRGKNLEGDCVADQEKEDCNEEKATKKTEDEETWEPWEETDGEAVLEWNPFE